MEKQLVTVIVPCYNQGKWLNECLDSIFASSYKNLEVIVVDDGSTDPLTVNIFDNFNRSGVRLIRQKNQGVCLARNNAVAVSKGDYILSVDSDDILAADYIEHAMECFSKHPDVDEVGADYVLITESSEDLSNPVHDLANGGYATSKIMCNNVITNNYVVTREAFCAIGGFSTDLSRLAIEDVDFTMRVFGAGYKIYLMPEVGLKYRQLGGSRNGNQLKRRCAKFIVLSHNWKWFLMHPRYILPFLFWNKFGKWLDDMPYAVR